MNCIAWNINKKNNEKEAYQLMKQYNSDLLFLIEATSFQYSKYNEFDSNKEYKFIDKIYDQNLNTKIICIAKKTKNVIHVSSEKRYDIYKCEEFGEDYYFFVVHLQSALSGETRSRQIHFDIANQIKEDFKSCKEKYGMNLFCVIGDFNCNPADDEMYQASGFNARPFKRIVLDDKKITFNYKEYEFLYNPILSFLSEETESYGSYYYSDPLGMIWNQFDQVIFNCELCKYYKNGYYIKQIENVELVEDGRINKSISDHLPLYVEFKKSEVE